MTENLIYQVGLTMINGVGEAHARQLLQTLGDAEAIFLESQANLEKIPGITSALAEEIKRPDVLLKAEKEIAFAESKQINLYFFTDPRYPQRLKQCADAPLLFYYRGNADLDAPHILSIVGTRQATHYGQEMTEKLLSDLSERMPNLLIVSGLAYGIDICAHTNALQNGLPTVGVLAHGLDRIYPSAHRKTAIEMMQNGGLLTDFPSGTFPDKPNFVRRNRIIAGLADATLVIESAEKGGSLITADLAFSYGRDVFAVPGRAYDLHSKGCNALIKQNKAALVTSAEDLIMAMRWDIKSRTHNKHPQQMQLLFPENEEKQKILSLLAKQQEMYMDELAACLDLPIQQLSSLLFELELDGMVKALPGNRYQPL